ncbi:MAG TPA: hypothetical protein VGI16_03485 [Candidatus Acidoferrum sp.]
MPSNLSSQDRRPRSLVSAAVRSIVFAALLLAAALPSLSQAPAGPANAATSAISTVPPSMPVEQIIQKFGERESEFRKERENYTYTQTFVVQTIDDESGRPDGEYRMTSDILFTPDGKRFERVTSAPAPTLERITLSQQDFNDLENVQPFVLTSEDLPKYDVKYIGREQLDEIATYVFDVAPKKIEKNQRYFQGRVWVDDKDMEIVKTDGKAVPDIIKKNNENVFPRFETFRENIEGNYWFPTYTRSDDVLHFSTGPIHMRMTVRYSNYKRFGSTIRIGAPVAVKPDKP